MGEAIAKLAEAQRRTDEHMVALQKQVGRLVNDFGFSLEDFTAGLPPPYLWKYHGVTELTLSRRYFDLGDGGSEEVDLYGEGQRDGHRVAVLVERRSRLGRTQAYRLADKLTKVADTLDIQEMLRVIVAMYVHPSAEDVFRETGVWIVSCSRINRPLDFREPPETTPPWQ